MNRFKALPDHLARPRRPCGSDGAILIEQNDEWAVQRVRYMTLETITPLSDDPTIKLPAVAAALIDPAPPEVTMAASLLHHS